MNFINSQPAFKSYSQQGLDAVLFYKGQFDRPIEKVFDDLHAGRFPDRLRGNFALYFKDADRVVLAVDHLPTTNMFWTEDWACHIFADLIPKTNKEPDWPIIHQMRLCWGGSVGDRTSFKDIKRLEPGNYLEKKLGTGRITIRSYINVYEHEPDSSITIEELSHITETIVEENTRNRFNLLWSSGTDSNTLYGFVRKLKRTDQCNLVSLYSSTSIISDERPQCEYLEQVYGVKANYFDVGKFIGVNEDVKRRLDDPNTPEIYSRNFKRSWKSFWWESGNFQKYTCLLDQGLTGHVTMTGEMGDQLFGSRYSKVFLNYLSQINDPPIETLASLFLITDIFRFKRIQTQLPEGFIKHLEGEPGRQMAYEAAHLWLQDTWSKIHCGDLINRVELLNCMYKGSHRCYNYDQLEGCTFSHPFSDYRLFWRIYRIPGDWKIQKGQTRRLSLAMVEDHVDPGPWTWSKSGVFIPMQSVADATKRLRERLAQEKEGELDDIV